MTLESALLCAFRHFSSLSVAFGTLKVIEAFPDGLALGGVDGIKHVVKTILADLEVTMGLSRHKNIWIPGQGQ